MNIKTNYLNEIIVDNFAGGGGASTGIELAAGRPVTIAINHDPAAILMHKTNHPFTKHMQENVWNIDPKEVCAGRPVGLAWFSPDCKHFSKAKGKTPVQKNIRGLAWVVLKWAGLVRPRVIILENVEEFKTWGPVRKGKPVKSKQGQTFNKWLTQLRALDYDVEYQELVAADYGAPTTRKRFVLIARCDGKPIVWPERTHAPVESEEVRTGKCKPWISAAEIIDWELPCPSIFEDKDTIKKKYNIAVKRPLKPNTLKRITRGIDKFVIKSPNPFILPFGVQINHSGQDRYYDLNKPLPTVTAKHGYGIAATYVTPLHIHNHSGAGGTDIRSPVNTITTGNCQMLIAPSLSKYFGGVIGSEINNPVPTVTSIDHNALLTPTLIQYHTEQSENVRGQHLNEPIKTIDCCNRYGFAAAHLTQYFKSDHYHSPNDPLHTVTTKIREGVTLAHVAEFKGQDKGQSVNNPLRTVTTSAGEFGTVQTTIVKFTNDVDLKYWPQVRELLNKYCGYKISENEILLLWIDGTPYFISDIGLRMLTPKELYRAQGFPDDYIIETDYLGNEYKKKEQVARAGNAVCPPMAAALVKANLPEWYMYDITTMAQLHSTIAV